MKYQNKIRTLNIAYIALFVAIMAICAYITVPGPVPFTLQTFGVFMAVLVLGGKKGTIAVLIYLALGSIGVPVFSGFRGGISQLFGATGGYIIGFLITSLVLWATENFARKKKVYMVISLALGLICCYAFGTAWYMFVYTRNVGSIGLWAAITSCVLPFIIPDALKIALAVFISKRIKKQKNSD